MAQLYALMKDLVKLINLNTEIEEDIKKIFIDAANILKPENVEETAFDGEFIARKKEDITYVEYTLPATFRNIPDNQADIPTFNIDEDTPRSIFWYDIERQRYLFQIFNQRNILSNSFILKKLGDNKFTKMNDKAFIVDDKIQAIHENGKLYFASYESANRIFSLNDYVINTTDDDIDNFTNNVNINLPSTWIKDKANTKTRRLISILNKKNNIAYFNGKAIKTRNRLLSKHGIKARIDENNQIVLSQKNVAELNRVLDFLNEDIFRGPITNNLFHSNSKKEEK